MVHHYHPSDDAYGLLMCTFVIFITLAILSFMLGIFTYTIYMIYLTILVFILVKIIEKYVAPHDTCLLTALIPLIITLIIGHILFNATIYFEPVPHRPYTPKFCMKTTDGKTFTDAYFGLPTTHIYIPFTKIHIYNPGKTTYYTDKSQYGWNQYETVNAYPVISRDGIPMMSTLAWRLTPKPYNVETLTKVFNKRGPNWEENYAKSIVTAQMAQNLASRYNAIDLKTPDMNALDQFQIKVKTDDFDGYICIDYTYIDKTLAECQQQQLSDSIYPTPPDNRPIYGEPGIPPVYPTDKCAAYKTKPTPDNFNRVTLTQ